MNFYFYFYFYFVIKNKFQFNINPLNPLKPSELIFKVDNIILLWRVVFVKHAYFIFFFIFVKFLIYFYENGAMILASINFLRKFLPVSYS